MCPPMENTFPRGCTYIHPGNEKRVLTQHFSNSDTPPHTVHPAVLQLEIITNIKQNKKNLISLRISKLCQKKIA